MPAPIQKAYTVNCGNPRFFADQTFHFQVLRVLTDVAAGGADVTETLQAISQIPEGDTSAWFDAFSQLAQRTTERTRTCADTMSRGLAQLRAHTYWRTAEFLLKPQDPRRTLAWSAQVAAFDQGLASLGIAHERIEVPYEGKALRAIHYPGPAGWQSRPLIVLVGGYDSTLEELYFVLVKAAHDRGYGMLTYEGPGQGAALREHGLRFTHEWERPHKAVMDTYLQHHATPTSQVLVGMSMGGYLAPRAAAFDTRIDGVVAYDVMFDMGSIAQKHAQLHQNPDTAHIPGVVWAVDNAMWTLGQHTMQEAVQAFQPYTLAQVAHQIRADVLVLAGAQDHFVPLAQAEAFAQACTGARSVETVVYDRISGGAEHCQLGAQTLWHAAFFDWMVRKFGMLGQA